MLNPDEMLEFEGFSPLASHPSSSEVARRLFGRSLPLAAQKTGNPAGH
jgi:hypothetical protein